MLDLVVTLGGVAYGAVLVAAMFLRNRVTEALRIDVLMLPRTSDATRVLNLLVGLALIGYNGYSLLQ